jgi:hypothetical protein
MIVNVSDDGGDGFRTFQVYRPEAGEESVWVRNEFLVACPPVPVIVSLSHQELDRT